MALGATARLLAAVALLTAGCGSSEPTATDGSSTTATTVAPITTTTSSTIEAAVHLGPLVRCEDIPELAATVEGSLSNFANPDDEVMGVLVTYGQEHSDTFAGIWIDRDAGGTLVLAFTDEPAPHLEAVLARGPSPDDVEVVSPRPPIRDPRPLGERDDVAIDVVQAEFTEAELMAANDEFWSDRPEYVLSGGVAMRRNRITIDLIDPTLEEIADLATRLPLDRGCVTVTISPTPPAGPLDVLPEDPIETQLTCRRGGGPSLPAAALDEPLPVEDSDHPAALVLLDTVADPPPTAALEDIEQPPPTDGWFVLAIDDATAVFGNGGPPSLSVAAVEADGDTWTFGWWSISCSPTVALPEGLSPVVVTLDPDRPPPAPGDTSIHVLATEQGCASGQPMGDRLRGPQVRETDDEILIAFAVETTVGPATCPGNPSQTVTIELAEPVGPRPIRNGLVYPPAEIESPESG